MVSPDAVHAVTGGYSLRGGVTYGVGVTGNSEDGPTRQENVNETVPYSQSLPSPDGAYWRCKRPDGSPRCFFAPETGKLSAVRVSRDGLDARVAVWPMCATAL